MLTYTVPGQEMFDHLGWKLLGYIFEAKAQYLLNEKLKYESAIRMGGKGKTSLA